MRTASVEPVDLLVCISHSLILRNEVVGNKNETGLQCDLWISVSLPVKDKSALMTCDSVIGELIS